jgi:hypothetical protein
VRAAITSASSNSADASTNGAPAIYRRPAPMNPANVGERVTDLS